MRRLAESERVRRFMRSVGAIATRESRAYFTGGASAVLLGWRPTTVDVDVAFVPDSDEILRSLPEIKERLELNIELASPKDFLPELPGWEGRSLFIDREGLVSFFHYDFYSQALAKIERGHEQDRIDVASMLDGGLVDPQKLRELFESIESQLYRYPAVDPKSLKSAVEKVIRPSSEAQ